MPRVLVFISLLCLLALPVSMARAGTVQLEGSASVAEFINRAIDPEKYTEESGNTLALAGTSEIEGIASLMTGKADIAMISLPIEILIEEIKANDLPVEASDFIVYPLYETEAFFAVHKDNPVKTLTHEQIAKIMSGQNRHWADFGEKQLGGIKVIAEKSDSASVRFIEKLFLPAGKTIVKERVTVENAPMIVRVASRLLDSFAFISFSGEKEDLGNLRNVSPDIRLSQTYSLVLPGFNIESERGAYLRSVIADMQERVKQASSEAEKVQ